MQVTGLAFIRIPFADIFRISQPLIPAGNKGVVQFPRIVGIGRVEKDMFSRDCDYVDIGRISEIYVEPAFPCSLQPEMPYLDMSESDSVGP